MKKRLISTVVLAGMLLTVPAMAATELTNGSPAGDTTVTARVVNEASSGDVAYTVSIPDKIDFGDLNQPANNESDIVTRAGTVKLESVEGLPDGYRVAVLVKDAADTEEDPAFRVIGQDTANAGKRLDYTIKNEASQANLLTGTRYANGYLVGAFQNTGDTVNLSLELDQQQLYGKYLVEWVGNYKGTLNFYAQVATVGSFN